MIDKKRRKSESGNTKKGKKKEGIKIHTILMASENVHVSVIPANATNQALTWTSSNTSVATVYTSGLVTAVAAGNATITVTAVNQAKTATCTTRSVSFIKN